jgi:predicted unusual protein kinase regulating ubiquinone biosynthesis (AarF/ABC1/UbiB family)
LQEESAEGSAIAWAREALAARGYRLLDVERRLRGRQADVSILAVVDQETGAHGRVVLKRLREDYVHNSPESLRVEFQALRAMSQSVLRSEDTRIVFPEPLEMSPANLTFLMGFLDGAPLDEHFRSKTHRVDKRLPGAILEGLRRYYAEMGTLYGDFTPANLLVRNGTLGFLDPTIPNPLFERTASQLSLAPLSADLGYWLYAVTVPVRRMALHPRQGARLLSLTIRLLRQAAEDLPPERRSVFLSETRRTAAVYLRPLLRQRVRNLLQHRIASILGRIVTTMAR